MEADDAADLDRALALSVEDDAEMQAAIQASMADVDHQFPAEAASGSSASAPAAAPAPAVGFAPNMQATSSTAPRVPPKSFKPVGFESLTVSEQIDHQKLEYLESMEADKNKDFDQIERDAKKAAEEYDRKKEEDRVRAEKEEEERQALLKRTVEENEIARLEKRKQDERRQQQQEADNILSKTLKRACRVIKSDVETLDASETIKLRFKCQAGGVVDGMFALEMSTKAIYDWADLYCCAEKDRMDLVGEYALKTQSILGSKSVMVDRSGCDTIEESGLKKGDVLVMDMTQRSGTKREAMS